MILEIIAKTCLIIAYVLLISVISLGIMSIAVALMPPTASVMTHWIVAFIEVKNVTFADGLLTAKLGMIIPEHHARKDYL